MPLRKTRGGGFWGNLFGAAGTGARKTGRGTRRAAAYAAPRVARGAKATARGTRAAAAYTAPRVASGARRTAQGARKAHATGVALHSAYQQARSPKKPAKRRTARAPAGRRPGANQPAKTSRSYQAGLAAAKRGDRARGTTNEYMKGYRAGAKSRRC